ncbi:helix-turn-helix transcriptional regulator [Kaistia dalseonensis]|uniref:Phage repressor protein C with HTH and peptisase S24 domain n=1 Tax=Kaistia dalseonensis TaxID=410840 RepID=A0ABU0HDR3_9HYPH|nr:helix-turn-helix transcriptional regulator [Kaistia dalseonensis]MCX5497820.1 helix-turn-helix transcriptional regulator [Kaistia dalseonensis]MDQ0440464.1 phage repressor protein C with HTH and peptisase S24 domain [Kaistia dalseonensis]
MLSHERIWAAIDLLAARNDLSASGLARKAGLDPTTFNRSKRVASDGRPRWPSTESIAKILEATGERIETFLGMISMSVTPPEPDRPFHLPHVPLIGFAQAGAGGFFDDGGFPAGQGWEEVAFPPAIESEGVYALEVSGDSMQPLYRDGDVIIVSPTAPCRRGDRVVVRTREGEVMAKVLARKTTKQIELLSLNPDHANRIIAMRDIDWVARIIWASQ